MSARYRLALVLIALLLPGAIASTAAGVWDVERRSFNLTAGSWRLRDHRQVRAWTLPPDVVEQLAPDAYRWSRYETEAGRSVSVYIAFYSGVLSTGAHDPAVCYPAQGWEITAAREADIPMGGAELLRARRLEVRLDGREERVLYWFQPVGRWPRSPWLEQLLRIGDSVLGTPEYAFVRLSSPTRGSGEDTLAQIGAELAPQVRRILEDVPLDR